MTVKQLNEIVEMYSRCLDSMANKREKWRIRQLVKSDTRTSGILKVIDSLKNRTLPARLSELEPSMKIISMKMFREYRDAWQSGQMRRGLPIYDSQVLPLPYDVRPATTSVRRLKYKFDNFDVELTCYPMSLGSFEIIGRIVGNVGGRLIVNLVTKRKTIDSEVDDLMMFVFEKVPRGDCRVVIASRNKELIGDLTMEL